MNLFNKTDLLFASALVLNVVFFTGLFYYDLNKDVGPSGTPDIAIATLKINTVQRKYDSQLSWKNLYQNSPIKDGDTIRTDEDSDAVILFNDGTEIQLDENSLIQLNFAKSLKIEFDKGMLQIKSKSETVNIFTKNKDLQVEKGQYRMERTGSENMKLTSESGSSKIKINGQDFTINSDQELQIGDKVELKDKLIQLVSPGNQAKFIVNDKTGYVDFSYILRKNFNSIHLEISPKRDFSYVTSKIPITGETVRAPIAEGIYYWRIRGQLNGKYHTSESRKISIIMDSPLVLYTPLNRSALPVKKESQSVFFSWSAHTVNNTYKLEISQSPNLKNADTKEINYNSITIDGLSKGVYYWRVSTIPVYKDSKAKVSPIFSFSIGIENQEEKEMPEEKKPSAVFKEARIPEDTLNPKDRDLSIKKDEPLKFTWQKQDDAVMYNFSLYDKNGPKKKIYEDKTKENRVKFQKFSLLREGDFSWEVFGINEKGEHSKKTEGNIKIKARDSLKKLKPEEIKVTSPQTIYRD